MIICLVQHMRRILLVCTEISGLDMRNVVMCVRICCACLGCTANPRQSLPAAEPPHSPALRIAMLDSVQGCTAAAVHKRHISCAKPSCSVKFHWRSMTSIVLETLGLLPVSRLPLSISSYRRTLKRADDLSPAHTVGYNICIFWRRISQHGQDGMQDVVRGVRGRCLADSVSSGAGGGATDAAAALPLLKAAGAPTCCTPFFVCHAAVF